jgi:hypothetical protein
LETKINLNSIQNNECLSFIDAGIACYAFALLDEFGLIDEMQYSNGFSLENLNSFPNPLVLQSACRTLIKHGIIENCNSSLLLTNKGKALYIHRGSITLIYSGYRNVLADQGSIAKNKPSTYDYKKIDSVASASASVVFGERYLNDLILQEMSFVNNNKSICDLGCGNANRLVHLTKVTGR